MKVKMILVSLLVFIPIWIGMANAAGDTAFRRAEEVYNSGNYLIAAQQFRSFIERFPESSLVVKAKFYVASCQKKSGESDEALMTYVSIIESGADKEDILAAIEEVGNLRSIQAREYLEKKISHSDIQMRGAVALALGKVGNKKTVQKMMEVLKGEKESLIQKDLLDAISSIGPQLAKLSSLKEHCRKGSEDLKINIVKLMSNIRKNEVVTFLSDELKKSSETVSPYIVWALARIDPYRYGVRIEGIIEREKNSYFIASKNALRFELVSPSEKTDRLKEFVNKPVILFGGEYNGKVLYTHIYDVAKEAR